MLNEVSELNKVSCVDFNYRCNLVCDATGDMLEDAVKFCLKHFGPAARASFVLNKLPNSVDSSGKWFYSRKTNLYKFYFKDKDDCFLFSFTSNEPGYKKKDVEDADIS